MILSAKNFARATLIATLAVANVHADFSPDCQYKDNGWTKKTNKIEDGNDADLSGCQQEIMSLKANNNLLGGSGSSSIVYIDSGSESKGCGGGDDCMEMCQALCCIVDGCIHATVKRDKTTEDYVVYQETVKKYYCRLYSSGDLKSSDSSSTCTASSSPPDQQKCATIASNAFGWDSTTYQQMVGAGSYDTCPQTGKRELQEVGEVDDATAIAQLEIEALPSEAEIDATVAELFATFAVLRENLKTDIEAHDADFCDAALNVTAFLKQKKQNDYACGPEYFFEDDGETSGAAATLGSVVLGALLAAAGVLIQAL